MHSSSVDFSFYFFKLFAPADVKNQLKRHLKYTYYFIVNS